MHKNKCHLFLWLHLFRLHFLDLSGKDGFRLGCWVDAVGLDGDDKVAPVLEEVRGVDGDNTCLQLLNVINLNGLVSGRLPAFVQFIISLVCCRFQRAFGCCALQTLVKICFNIFLTKKQQKKRKSKKIDAKFRKIIFWPALQCSADKHLSKYTTLAPLFGSPLFGSPLLILCLSY